jgi:hypothetical protein
MAIGQFGVILGRSGPTIGLTLSSTEAPASRVPNETKHYLPLCFGLA